MQEKLTRLEMFTLAALSGCCADPNCKDADLIADWVVHVAKKTLDQLDAIQSTDRELEKEMD